jgi:alpha-beta hydrolase superfamily lysophospholipase
MDDGVRLYVREWKPEANSGGKPRAVLHIVHGMAEHSLRYERLARRLSQVEIEVWAADHRGHGKTADPSVNDPGRGGLLGHCADKDGFNRVTADIDIINRAIRKEHPGVPLFLMGHSWGSFAAQNYIETFGGLNAPEKDPVNLAGCVLSGTRGPGGVKTALGAPFMNILAFVRGTRGKSRLARAVADGPYSRPFRPNRTAFDWLSRDESEVDAYVEDPLCGYLCSAGFYRDLLGALNRIHRQEALGNIRSGLPVYIFSGTADPVGEMGESPMALSAAYRIAGLKDVELVLYPEARHETLNETNRDEVTESLLSWLERHCTMHF